MAPADLGGVEEVVVIAGRDLVLTRPAESDALLDEEAFEHEEFLPYWAELWPSARALARRVGVLALHGARVLELGCGLGLPSIAAALAGGRVLATDWSPDAIAYAGRNATANDARIETAVASWSAPDELAARGPWDLVMGSDLLYERRNVDPLLDALERLVAPGASAILADPGRPAAAAFLARAPARWDVTTTTDPEPPPVALHAMRRRAPD
jgi:predicted nicotinamide N-methyase